MIERPEQNYVGTKSVRKLNYSQDPNEHTFIDYKDLCGNYVDYTVQLADTDVYVALDNLYYSIVDFLYDEFYQDIEEDRNIHHKQNYELVKKHLDALKIIKRCKDVLYITTEFDEELYSSEEIEREGGQKYYLCDGSDQYRKYRITKEEYDLLKEVLDYVS